MDLLDNYQKIVKELTKQDIDISIKSFKDVGDAIETVESLEINFIKLGYSDSLVKKYYDAKTEFLIFLNSEKKRLSNEISVRNETDAIKFTESNKSFNDFIEVLKKNKELAAYIILYESDLTKRYAMQANLQRILTGRKLLFTNKSSQPELRKIVYPNYFDLKLNKLEITDQTPEPSDIVISIVSKKENYVYAYKHLEPASEITGVTLDAIRTTQTIFEEIEIPTYVSPIDIISCECVNWIDPLYCDYSEMLRPLYVRVNENLYKGRCIDNIQLMAPDIDSYVSKNIIQKVRAHENSPSSVKYEELYIPKIKHAIKLRLDLWEKPEDKVKNTDIICDLISKGIMESLMQLPSDIYLMAKIAIDKMIFKERKSIMDSYRFMSSETIKPIIMDMIDRNEKNFKTLNENLTLFCKIIS